MEAYGKEFMINEGDGAFYGPKIDIHIKDALGRTWQCGTIQLDMALPERFDLTYKGADNEKHRPIMIHRVIYGSMERFFGILVEHFAGKFPMWLAPVQAVVLPINQDLAPYAKEIQHLLEVHDIRCEVDERSETLKKKIREAQLDYIPLDHHHRGQGKGRQGPVRAHPERQGQDGGHPQRVPDQGVYPYQGTSARGDHSLGCNHGGLQRKTGSDS